jgi:hypothetical protein
MTAAELAISAGVLLAALIAGFALRGAWRMRGPSRVWLIAGGWALMLAICVLAGSTLGSGRGTFAALAFIPVAVLGLVASGVEFRQARAGGSKSLAPEPSERGAKAWRGWLRVLLAGPIGGLAAMGAGIAISAWLPTDDRTRIVTGGLVVLAMWASAMAWTLADDKILRATAVLVSFAVLTFGAAALKGF